MLPYQYYGSTPYYPMYQQQPAYQQPRGSIMGRVVSCADDIQISEIPTDGTMALFPTNDGSAIYGKRWTQDGNIATVKYTQEQEESKPDPMAEILKKLDQVLEVLQ